MSDHKISISGRNLSIEAIDRMVMHPRFEASITTEALKQVRSAETFLNEQTQHRIIYGINTGFGPMASHLLGKDQLDELQANLINSHAVGMGEPVHWEYVLAAMVIRLNTLAIGKSGVSEDLLQRLQLFINRRVLPLVPEHGAVGTSGDLVQLAHISLALTGEGSVWFEGKIIPAREALKSLSLEPYQFKVKEGLAMINGTSMMTGIASRVCSESARLVDTATRTGAWAMELVQGFEDSISERLHATRPHRGQQAIARRMRQFLSTSSLLRRRSEIETTKDLGEDVQKLPEAVQEVYSLRCIPQILGPVYDALAKTWGDVEVEMNSVTDNPVVDWEAELFLHGGNFHGDVIAASIDQLKMTLVKLTMLTERRINYFLNHDINKRFPPFLNIRKPGLTLALQGLQFVATSTAAQSQSLGFPHYLHSIPTNGDNQDVVSMGADAALLAAKVVDNAYVLLAIEAITLAQAVNVLGVEDKLSESSRALYKLVREVFPVIDADRVLTDDLPKVVSLIKALPVDQPLA